MEDASEAARAAEKRWLQIKANGPQRMPDGRPVMPYTDDVEVEIRRQVTRHHHQLAEIARLETELAGWKQRAELGEAEIAVLVKKLTDSEHEQQRLRDIITRLKAGYESSADILVKGIEILREFEPKPVAEIAAPEGGTNDASH